MKAPKTMEEILSMPDAGTIVKVSFRDFKFIGQINSFPVERKGRKEIGEGVYSCLDLQGVANHIQREMEKYEKESLKVKDFFIHVDVKFPYKVQDFYMSWAISFEHIELATPEEVYAFFREIISRMHQILENEAYPTYSVGRRMEEVVEKEVKKFNALSPVYLFFPKEGGVDMYVKDDED